MNCSKGSDHTLPGSVQTCAGYLTLPGQDLPQAKVGLENPYGIGAHDRRRDAIESFNRLHKGRDGFIAQTRKLREDGILVAELPESAGQHGDRGGAQTLLWRPPAVNFTQCEVNLQRLGSRRVA